MARNRNLNKARTSKNDEFYTLYEDIENELQHYKSKFKDKVVYCNCDDYRKSNFFKYFKDNFNRLGLKLLIATHYVDNSVDIFDIEKRVYAYRATYDGKVTMVERLLGNGDFRSVECVNILKEADVVVTNPPFSLFRELVKLIVDNDKRFVLIGNQNTVATNYIYNLFRDNRLWCGKGFKGNATHFETYYDDYASSADHRDGKVRVSGVVWYTNVQYEIDKKYIELTREYRDGEYDKYDDYEAIEVSFVKDIPKDYCGTMGVPISIVEKFNHEQFEIVGDLFTPSLKGKKCYKRIPISHRRKK